MLASRQGATGSLSNQDRGNSKAKASRLLTRSPPAMRARPRASRSEKPPSTLSAPALSKRSTSLTPLSASGRLIEIRVPPPASSAETCSRSPCSALSTSAPNSRNSSRSASSGSTAAATSPRDGRTAASTLRLPAISRNSLAPRSTSVPRSTRSRDEPGTSDTKQGVSERRTNGKGADDVRVHTIAVILLLPRDRASNEGTPRRPFDPGDLASRPAFPAEQRRQSCGLRRICRWLRRLARAQAPTPFDPVDHILQRGRWSERLRGLHVATNGGGQCRLGYGHIILRFGPGF